MAPLVAQQITVFPTRLGWMVIVGQEDLLQRVSFGHTSKSAALAAVHEDIQGDAAIEDWNSALVARLQAYASGTPDDFRDIQVDLSHLSPFARRVAGHCRRIGYGEKLSYAELASKAGAPGAARAVGSVMANNRCPLVVPCHRVVASGGGLGGFSAPGGTDVKQRLLVMEDSTTKTSGQRSRRKTQQKRRKKPANSRSLAAV